METEKPCACHNKINLLGLEEYKKGGVIKDIPYLIQTIRKDEREKIIAEVRGIELECVGQFLTYDPERVAHIAEEVKKEIAERLKRGNHE